MSTTEQLDLYPSRVRDEPEILPRLDPVVYRDSSEEDGGPLTAEQLDQFERDGFLVLHELFTEIEVLAFQSELAELCRSDECKGRPEAIVEPDSNELRSLFAIHRLSPLFKKVAADKRLAGTATQILGSDVYIHQSRVNLKPGFAGKEFYWHSDFETWHIEDGMPRMRAVSCSILLTSNNEFNSPLLLIPGSHQDYVTCVGETPEEHYTMSLKRQDIGVPDNESLSRLVTHGGIRSAAGAPGTLVLFDCNTMHGSNSNISPYPRSNLFFVYNSVENRLCDPFCGLKPRPEFISSRLECDPVVPADLNLQPQL